MAALLVGISLLVIQAGPARACTCNQDQPAQAVLAASDAAFVGVLVFTRPLTLADVGGDVTAYQELIGSELGVVDHFEVERAVKGELGRQVQVVHSGSGAGCGLSELSVGQRSGLSLHRRADVWGSSMCHKIEPDRLVALATKVDNRPEVLTASDLPLFLVAGVVLLAIPLAMAVRRRR